MKTTALLAAAGTTVALLAGAGTQLASATPSPGCAALKDPIYQAASRDGVSLFTPWSDEVAKAGGHG